MGATNISEVCVAMQELLVANQQSLGLQAVYYGDQALVPQVPAVAIEPGNLRIIPTQTAFKADHFFEVFAILYHSTVTDDQVRRLETDQYAEAVKDLLNGTETDKTMGGTVIFGMVTEIAYGYAQRGGMMRAARITWSGRSKERI